MYYIYFLPKQSSVSDGYQPWKNHLYIGFENKAMAEHYLTELKKYSPGIRAVMIKNSSLHGSRYLVSDKKVNFQTKDTQHQTSNC